MNTHLKRLAGLYLFLACAVNLQAAVTPDIQLDQVGYLPQEAKLAMVSKAGAMGPFAVRRVSDKTLVFKGQLNAAAVDANSGVTLRTADFSSVTVTGHFYLNVPGVGQSYPFRIDPAVYQEAFYLATRFFYGQRCGTAVDLAPTFPGYSYEACHTEDGVYHASSGKTGKKASGKGWHDAGDYGKYIVNSGISTGELLWTYEFYPDRVGKVKLDIPESGNATPDILDEARWNLEWMLTMQDDDGGVWHKLTTLNFDPFEMPEKDSAGTRYIIGTGTGKPFKTTASTADFAAVMAIAARLYKPFDEAFAGTCLRASTAAWKWLQKEKNSQVPYQQPTDVRTGGYGNGDFRDEILWASAELFRTTGMKEYNDYFLKSYTAFTPLVSGTSYPQDWATVHHLAMWAYFYSGQSSRDPAACEKIREDTLSAAATVTARQNTDGYKVALGPGHYVWGSNGGVANFGILMLIADDMASTPAFRQAALDNLHYLLGRNSHQICYVSRLGTKYMMKPHHRPSGADRNELPWPGMLSGGPNARGGDPVIKAMSSKFPADRYIDDQESYASNEVAINWNAPLVFLLAGLIPAASEPTPE